MKSNKETLIALRDWYLENPSRWIKNGMFFERNPHGEVIAACLVGGIAVVKYGSKSISENTVKEGWGKLAQLLPSLADGSHITAWNDAPSRRFEDVIDLLSRAIEVS